MRSGGLKHRDEKDINYNLSASKVEPDIVTFDNIITQNDTEEYQNIINFREDELQDLAERCLGQIVDEHPSMKEYKGKPVLFPEVIHYKHDEYPVPFKGADDGIVVMCNFSRAWSNHWGGETLFFKDSEPCECITSFPGRVIVVKNNCAWQVRQPNINATQNLLYLIFRVKN